MKSNFFSTGKLLLTSEYVVLDGALALAIPTKLGQEFSCEEIYNHQSEIIWEAFHQGKEWLNIKIDYRNWKIIETNITSSAEFVLRTLQIVSELSKLRFKGDISYHIRTNLQFPADFGWGSSSTLMVNLAEWSQVDAFLLNERALGGSGYDIAVAKEKKSLLYQIKNKERKVSIVDFEPLFKDELLFVHLNQKQDSREGIKMYRLLEKNPRFIDEFSEITKEIVSANSLGYFSSLMEKHEDKLSTFLNIPTVKQQFFSDCPVFVKSLGAWGGDFVLTSKFFGYQDYFLEKGFKTILGWDDVI